MRIRIRWDRASSTQTSGAKRPFTIGMVILFILAAAPMLEEVILNVR
ncbi:MAG TPA: hypothetical protein VFQ10_08450 [Rubrobacter sp.]|nr:hypothetical protein [Rubrobacter sp.]